MKYSISPEYLDAAGHSFAGGQDFLAARRPGRTSRGLGESRFLAIKMFGSVANAIGGYYKIADGTRIQVVGIVEDGKYSTDLTRDRQPAMFLPILQAPSSETTLVVRSNRDPRELAAGLEECLRALDPAVPV